MKTLSLKSLKIRKNINIFLAILAILTTIVYLCLTGYDVKNDPENFSWGFIIYGCSFFLLYYSFWKNILLDRIIRDERMKQKETLEQN